MTADMARTAKTRRKKKVETLIHEDASRKNIPTAEYESILQEEDRSPIRVAYKRRNRDLDPQLVWRGKDEQDWSDLVVHAPPLYIQEKVHPKALIDDLRRQTERAEVQAKNRVRDLFADFNGLPDEAARTEFYQHDANWSNRMILGDSLQVMASLAEREGLRGKIQCIYLDPPYGIKFNSNFQWSTTSREVKDKAEHITREPEQVKAFRDTWRDGIHSYLTYLRDRLIVARELLAESGSVFVQIGDENVHRVRALMDEVFGDNNHISTIVFRKKTMPFGTTFLEQMSDTILWYGKRKEDRDGHAITKYRQLKRKVPEKPDGIFRFYQDKEYRQIMIAPQDREHWDASKGSLFRLKSLEPSGPMESGKFRPIFEGKQYEFPRNGYGLDEVSLDILGKAGRLASAGRYLNAVLFKKDGGNTTALTTPWFDTTGPRTRNYVVQTGKEVIQRCILMATDPGDLVLDPTCGSGTTAYVAEQWGRRWITIDTSRVALALARARVMGARYSYYLLADSRDGQIKEAEISRKLPSDARTYNDIRQGFVYESVPHITLKSIANNAEIDVIWEKFQEKLEPLRAKLNDVLGTSYEEWEIPRDTDDTWSETVKSIHTDWWKQRIARQKEIDASIVAKTDYEYLYDKPYEDKKKVRVAGPFTVESLSPHRALVVDAEDELIDPAHRKDEYGDEQDFAQMILENLKTAGVQQAHKDDRIDFISLVPWPGNLVCAEGKYMDESGVERRAAVFIGPEFGTVSRQDLVSAAREAADAGFDVLIACAFNYDAHSTDFEKLGYVPVLKARMNADLHMADNLKNTGKGNLFVIFGEPDIDIVEAEDDQIRVRIKGVDVFHPNTGEVRSDDADGIACWFIDTDYNEESFFVRHAYFLGANDPYKSLKTTLKAEINREAWETLNSDISRPFDKPKNGRIAVKVINHLGDEVMKVYRV